MLISEKKKGLKSKISASFRKPEDGHIKPKISLKKENNTNGFKKQAKYKENQLNQKLLL